MLRFDRPFITVNLIVFVFLKSVMDAFHDVPLIVASEQLRQRVAVGYAVWALQQYMCLRNDTAASACSFLFGFGPSTLLTGQICAS